MERRFHKYLEGFILLVCLIAIGIGIFNTGSVNIFKKNMEADLGGGLDRIVTIYSVTGTPIKSWEGKIDLADYNGGINMLINGNRRVVLRGGIVIVEEK